MVADRNILCRAPPSPKSLKPNCSPFPRVPRLSSSLRPAATSKDAGLRLPRASSGPVQGPDDPPRYRRRPTQRLRAAAAHPVGALPDDRNGAAPAERPVGDESPLRVRLEAPDQRHAKDRNWAHPGPCRAFRRKSLEPQIADFTPSLRRYLTRRGPFGSGSEAIRKIPNPLKQAY